MSVRLRKTALALGVTTLAAFSYVADAQDTDGDGLSDADEITLGTDLSLIHI